MKFNIKRNYVYLIIFVFCLLIMFMGLLSTQNLFEIIELALTKEGFINDFFLYQEDPQIAAMTPSILNIIKVTTRNAYFQLDYSIIMSTMWFQIIIPLFALVSGFKFYRSFHSIMSFEFVKVSNYKKHLIREIIINALKLSLSIFLAYLFLLVFINLLGNLGPLGASSRSLFSDILGDSFYQNHTVTYFILEGIIRFFIIPFVYSTFCQSIVLLGLNLKEVFIVPIIYYYGLSAIGYALHTFIPALAIYINPTVIMASGDYESFNTLLLILVNMIPMFIAYGIILYRGRYVEI